MDHAAFLKSLQVFRPLSVESAQLLADRLEARTYAPGERILAEGQVVDEDTARVAETAATLAEAHPERARRLLRIAVAQWEGLGRVEEAEAARRQLRP